MLKHVAAFMLIFLGSVCIGGMEAARAADSIRHRVCGFYLRQTQPVSWTADPLIPYNPLWMDAIDLKAAYPNTPNRVLARHLELPNPVLLSMRFQAETQALREAILGWKDLYEREVFLELQALLAKRTDEMNVKRRVSYYDALEFALVYRALLRLDQTSKAFGFAFRNAVSVSQLVNAQTPGAQEQAESQALKAAREIWSIVVSVIESDSGLIRENPLLAFPYVLQIPTFGAASGAVENRFVGSPVVFAFLKERDDPFSPNVFLTRKLLQEALIRLAAESKNLDRARDAGDLFPKAGVDWIQDALSKLDSSEVIALGQTLLEIGSELQPVYYRRIRPLGETTDIQKRLDQTDLKIAAQLFRSYFKDKWVSRGFTLAGMNAWIASVLRDPKADLKPDVRAVMLFLQQVLPPADPRLFKVETSK